MKILSLLLIFYFFCISSVAQASSLTENISNFFSKEYEEYANPDDLYYEILKEFIDQDYVYCVEKINKFKKYYSFYKNIKALLLLEVLSNFLGKKYEAVEQCVDDYMAIFERDDETFYLLYMKALSLRKIVTNSKTNMGIAMDSLKLFRLLLKKSDITQGSESSNLGNKNTKHEDNNYNFSNVNYEKFRKSIEQNIKELKAIVVQSNSEIEEYYFDSSFYIAALNRNLFVVNNDEDLYSKEDKDKAFKRINIIFNKILNN